MKLRLITSIILTFLFFSSFSQNKLVDVVYLNDGSIIKGSIIEYFVNDHVIIESINGKVYRFNASEIKNVNADVSEKYFLSTGFYNNTTFGVLIGENNYNNPLVNFTFNMVNGYQLNNKIQTGIGIGMDVIYQQMLFPVSFDLKYYLRKSSFSPFVGAFIGYSFQTKKDENDTETWNYYNLNEIKSGRMYGAEIGIRNYTKEDVGYTLSIGYRFQYLSTKYQDWRYNTEVTEEHYLNRFKLTLGIIFN